MEELHFPSLLMETGVCLWWSLYFNVLYQMPKYGTSLLFSMLCNLYALLHVFALTIETDCVTPVFHAYLILTLGFLLHSS